MSITKKITKIEWTPILSRGRHPFLVIDSAWRGVLFYYKSILKISFNPKYYRRSYETTYLATHEWNKIIKELDNKLKNSYLNLYQPIQTCQKITQKLLKFSKNIYNQDFTNTTTIELQKLANKFFKQYSKITVGYYIPWFIEELLEKKKKKLLTFF